MIILTGAAGFIGSHLAEKLKAHRLLLVDNPGHFRARGYFQPQAPEAMDFATDRMPEERHKVVDRAYFPKVLGKLKAATPTSAAAEKTPNAALVPPGEKIEWVIHIGACTDTGETDKNYLDQWNVDYTKSIWEWCAREGVPLIYASSAATYGNGSAGFSDEHKRIPELAPLNPYGQSKQDFDLWALDQVKAGEKTPPHWYGLKFFNVYGPQEGHKGRMASAVLHSYRSIIKTGRCPLFRSHNPSVRDGEQSRDFIHVDDIVTICEFLREKKPASGIYNCGTGRARTFLDLIKALYASLGQAPQIDWMDTPEKYRKAYQYFTQAEMQKLTAAGFDHSYLSLEEGVARYVAWLQEHERVFPDGENN